MQPKIWNRNSVSVGIHLDSGNSLSTASTGILQQQNKQTATAAISTWKTPAQHPNKIAMLATTGTEQGKQAIGKRAQHERTNSHSYSGNTPTCHLSGHQHFARRSRKTISSS